MKKRYTLGRVVFSLQSACESCCEPVEPYTPMVMDSGVTWCMDCARTSDMPTGSATASGVRSKAKRLKIRYFKKRIEELGGHIVWSGG